ncbi:MAG: sigma-70 family RNA polymerase sigma factor [Aestuariivirgaceae bacterium]
MFEVAASMETALRSQRQKQRNALHAGLLARVANDGDKAAFTDLFAHFGPLLKGFMMRKGANAELAEDLAQETMVTVWRKAALYAHSKGSVSTWIFTIARNLRIDTFRRTSGVKFADLNDFEFESDNPASDHQVNARQENDRLRDAIRKLPDDQQQVIQLAFMDDLTQMEIADKLGQPLGTVKSRMRLAYQKLSRTLEDLR